MIAGFAKERHRRYLLTKNLEVSNKMKVIIRYVGEDGNQQVVEYNDEVSWGLATSSSFAMESCIEDGGSTVVFSTDPETFCQAVELFRNWNPRKRQHHTSMERVEVDAVCGNRNAKKEVEAIVLEDTDEEDTEELGRDAHYRNDRLQYKPMVGGDSKLLTFYQSYKFTSNPVDSMWHDCLPRILGAGDRSFSNHMIDMALDIVLVAARYRDTVLKRTWTSALTILGNRLNPAPCRFYTALLLNTSQVEKLLHLFQDGSLPLPPSLCLSRDDAAKELFPRLYVAEMANLISCCLVGGIRVGGTAGMPLEHELIVFPGTRGWATYETLDHQEMPDGKRHLVRLSRKRGGWTAQLLEYEDGEDTEGEHGKCLCSYTASGSGSLPFPPPHGWRLNDGEKGPAFSLIIDESYGIYNPNNYRDDMWSVSAYL